jgi:hypothetical protein
VFFSVLTFILVSLTVFRVYFRFSFHCISVSVTVLVSVLVLVIVTPLHGAWLSNLNANGFCCAKDEVFFIILYIYTASYNLCF